MAQLRFWVFLGLLLLAVLVVAVTVWGEIGEALRNLAPSA